MNKEVTSDERSDYILLEKLAKDFIIYQIDNYSKKVNNLMNENEISKYIKNFRKIIL